MVVSRAGKFSAREHQTALVYLRKGCLSHMFYSICGYVKLHIVIGINGKRNPYWIRDSGFEIHSILLG